MQHSQHTHTHSCISAPVREYVCFGERFLYIANSCWRKYVCIEQRIWSIDLAPKASNTTPTRKSDRIPLKASAGEKDAQNKRWRTSVNAMTQQCKFLLLLQFFFRNLFMLAFYHSHTQTSVCMYVHNRSAYHINMYIKCMYLNCLVCKTSCQMLSDAGGALQVEILVGSTAYS